MHPLLFSFKRVVLRGNRFARAFAKHYQLTPARYDLLVAIAKSPHGIAQMDLRHVIGVTKSVICRMLYQLEDLGLVWRHPHPRNDRFRWVRLTERGATKLVLANAELMGPGSLVDQLVLAAVTRTPEKPGSARRGYVAATNVTDILRERLGDRATLHHPFFPAPRDPWRQRPWPWFLAS